MNKSDIIDEIQRTARANGGRPLGRQRFLRETGIRESDWSGRYWAKWSDALREAGFAPNELQQPFDTEVLVKSLIHIVEKLGKWPTIAEIKIESRGKAELPSHNVYRRLGTMSDQARAVLEYCRIKGAHPDVVAICAPVASVETATSASHVVEDDAFGYVYLMKSGKHYKIGRSDHPGRREYELGIQLPERVQIVHTIRTDDPIGIEAYWHNRFSEQRANGEWFALSAKQVSAFRQRRFM